MVSEIIDVMAEALTGLVSSLTTVVLDVFGDLIYNPTDGLTDFAAYKKLRVSSICE
jgi:hypothetical protein